MYGLVIFGCDVYLIILVVVESECVVIEIGILGEMVLVV